MLSMDLYRALTQQFSVSASVTYACIRCFAIVLWLSPLLYLYEEDIHSHN